MTTKAGRLIGRRPLLAAAGGALAMPFIAHPSLAAGQVIVRTPGGVYDDIMRRNVYDPFTKETGIQVMPVAATVSKLLAMFKAGNVELDLIDTGDGPLETLRRAGALADIDYGAWKLSKPADIDPHAKFPTRVASFIYATVLSWSTDTFKGDAHPASWQDFWDLQKYPGPRSLADMASGQPNLEFALIADGVPMDKLFPLDVDRALKSMSRVKPAIRKFWDTGAISAQLLTDKEVVAGSIWNGRLQLLINGGAPLGLEWNQHMIQVQALGVFKGARNAPAAQQLIDYMMQPKVQAGYCKELIYGPTNVQAKALMPPDVLKIVPGGPSSENNGFYQDISWWEDNRAEVSRKWARWVLS